MKRISFTDGCEQKAILPTILGNFQKARAADPNAKKSEKPTGGPPTDAKEA